jgi:hypothetical protein
VPDSGGMCELSGVYQATCSDGLRVRFLDGDILPPCPSHGRTSWRLVKVELRPLEVRRLQYRSRMGVAIAVVSFLLGLGFALDFSSACPLPPQESRAASSAAAPGGNEPDALTPGPETSGLLIGDLGVCGQTVWPTLLLAVGMLGCCGALVVACRLWGGRASVMLFHAWRFLLLPFAGVLLVLALGRLVLFVSTGAERGYANGGTSLLNIGIAGLAVLIALIAPYDPRADSARHDAERARAEREGSRRERNPLAGM